MKSIIFILITTILTGCQTYNKVDTDYVNKRRQEVYEYVVDPVNSSIPNGIVRVYPVDTFGNRMYHKSQLERRGDRLYEIKPDGKIEYLGVANSKLGASK